MPPRAYHFWVYILASRSRNLYIGVTNDLLQRTTIHKRQTPDTYTARYNIHRLVYFEHFKYIRSAIGREKQLKRFTRAQKIALIEQSNPTWEDLYSTLQIRANQNPIPPVTNRDWTDSQGQTLHVFPLSP